MKTNTTDEQLELLFKEKSTTIHDANGSPFLAITQSRWTKLIPNLREIFSPVPVKEETKVKDRFEHIIIKRIAEIEERLSGFYVVGTDRAYLDGQLIALSTMLSKYKEHVPSSLMVSDEEKHDELIDLIKSEKMDINLFHEVSQYLGDGFLKTRVLSMIGAKTLIQNEYKEQLRSLISREKTNEGKENVNG